MLNIFFTVRCQNVVDIHFKELNDVKFEISTLLNLNILEYYIPVILNTQF